MIEANTGGESTSLMAVYDSWQKAVKVGPVCQGRDLFLQLVMPVNAIPMYIGSDIYTSNLVNWYTYQPLDGLYIGVNAYNLDGERDQTAPEELSWYADARLIQSAVASYGQSTQGDTPPSSISMRPPRPPIPAATGWRSAMAPSAPPSWCICRRKGATACGRTSRIPPTPRRRTAWCALTMCCC